MMGIMEQQIATVKNLLPGAKKSLPYMSETSKRISTLRTIGLDIHGGHSRVILEAHRAQ